MYESQDLSAPLHCMFTQYQKTLLTSIKMSKTYGWFVFQLAKTENGVCPLGPHQVKS